ncbi:phospholipid-translocating ATPase [Crucibulum laeve]|uniref:Phospholipid-transporting ATPase n=1 Tax=Crucibulum laeve TaxID=68775 RepID=A0A5C3LTV7_9AGAR|nr:phospholipid-translocating ATPase [Crucibulum laeve]
MASIKPSAGFAGWYARIAAFNVEDLFSRKREPGPPRTVYVNEGVPEEYYDHKHRVKKERIYTSNQVITSKYTVFTFLPRNLLEQFRRIANMFFLAIAVLQFFPKFSTISPGVVILPLVIIIGITAAKDGYEDFKRHQSDKKVNYSKVWALSGGKWMNTNPMQAKSRTFIRGMIPQRHKTANPPSITKVSSFTSSTDAPEGDPSVEFDYKDVCDGGPHWKRTLWEDVRVGDFVKLMDNESFPCDILICATSEDDNVAFVETKNLDGETNLKSRHAVPSLTHLRTAKECADPQNSFRVKCDRPDTDMYRLNANVTGEGQTSPVDLSMTLLRGTVLRNTGWAIGVVLFTGEDTKIVMNSGGTPSKRSKVERQMNPQVFINLLLLAAMAVVCGIADSSLERHYFPLGAPWLFNDDRSDDNPKINGLITWAFALLTFQDIVPISLYISIEFVRTCQAAFIYFDADIWYEKTNQATIARSWNLSDDLGQIEYIFSDKTGTLTQNSMVFRQCSIGGRAYRGDSDEYEDVDDGKSVSLNVPLDSQPINIELYPQASSSTTRIGIPAKSKKEIVHFKDSLLQADLDEAISPHADPQSEPRARNLNGFFTVLALCHTVLTAVDPATGEIEYKAQSPDESALVQAAADVGYVFLGKDREILSLQKPGETEPERYELLNILEFNSARKRMSVVLRKVDDEDHRIFLLTKGADNVIFERLRREEEEMMQETEKHLSEFANNGLRTLTLAFRVISDEEYQAWSERYHEATIAMDNREEQIEAVSNELEQQLRLLGATAIEDRLQDGVPETIADLKRAGIKIWVATGDKLETAIAIGRSTNLIAHDSNIVIIRGGSSRPVEQQMLGAIEQFFPESEFAMNEKNVNLPRTSREEERQIPLQRVNTGVSSIVGPENGERPGGFVLVVDGAALLEAFADEANKALLLRLATLCEGVICCRVSPLQKALIVRLVKDGLGAMTLAIGDGANDVSMIQAADVGIGISGEEGLQAVNSSDYAIAQFRFLKKLILVHGHWSYARNGTMILNFFYKNIVAIGVLWWFQIYDGWSANYVFDYTYVLFWNSLWTIAPVVGIGLFDRMLDSRVLMELPELYHYGREGHWFGIRSFLVYMMDGIVQSAVIYFLILYTYVSPTSRSDGYDVRLQEFSTTMAISAVMVANIFTGFSATAWTGWVFFAVFVGIVIVWVFTAVYSAISPGRAVTMLYGNDELLFTSAYFWLCIPLTFFLSLAPRYIAKAWKFGFDPDDIDIVRWMRKKDPYMDLSRFGRVGKGTTPGLVAFQQQGRASSTSIVSRDSIGSMGPQFDRARTQSRLSMDARTPSRTDFVRSASRTDMATGLVSVDRGFDFATEENGVAMKRIQSNLSERRLSSGVLQPQRARKGKETLSHVFSLRRIKRSRKVSDKKGESSQ